MILRAFAVALSLASAASLLGQDAPSPKSQSELERPDAIRKLSKRERRQRLEKLPERHQEFAANVEPIMLPAELDMFLSLEDDNARDTFVEEFWRRRDHVNHTSGVFKEAYFRRLERARELFQRVSSDRARLFLLHGPPADVVRTNCARLLQPIEIWKYAQLPGLGRDAMLMFYKPRHQPDYKLWSPIGGAVALADLLIAKDSVSERGPEDSRAREALMRSASPYSYISQLQLACPDSGEITAAITQMVQARIDLLKLFEPPELNAEDVRKMLRSVIISNPAAPKLTTEFSVAYPTKDGSRTDVQMMLLVPRSQLSPAEAGGTEVYTIDVTGEVLRDGELWEKYRYRFDFPAEVKAEKFPIVIDRLLRPAEYLSRVKVTDANTGAEAVVETPLNVPEIFVPETETPSNDSLTAARLAELPASLTSSSVPPPVTTLKQEIVTSEPRLRIVPPTGEIVSGLQTVETIVTGDGIKGVEFWMDGRKLAIRRAPPYSLDLDFGEVPQTRRIRAVALDARDQALTGDELTVNTGTDPFRVRIVSPRIAPRLTGTTRVEMDVSVPDGDELASLELYFNETRVATLFDAPFVQTIDLPSTEGAAYLRAVATLKDSTIPPVEDVVIINTPAYMEELNVHLIELPTTVVLNGKPTDKLTAAAFKVLDEGRPVQIAKFDYVKDLPLSLGLAIDSSGSMMYRMQEAQKAGAQFFQNVMRKGDKAFVVAFDTEPQMVQKWSTKLSALHAGLAKLRAEESTALYDAIVYALYNFHGIRGQKALVLISDGKDTASKFSYEQAFEYARRAGVPIYGIGLGIKPNENDVRYKLDRICRETGGTTFYIDQARDLQRVYDDIQAELRSQYVLGFYPSADVKPGSKWREVTVRVTEGKVKTIKGYFP
ncbi:MAG TPA: VWA domain-containing protein [Thermoanaerobaculia bacterium]|nr:VWA domain-containing protein [Thermoanaerobaculia bacterium]